MKNKLILTLALSVLATGAFAEDGFDRTKAHTVHAMQTQSATFAEDGFDRTNGARFAEDGFDRTHGARFAEEGFDRTNGHRVT
ncbi:MAG TPA: heme utilization protein [Pseudomonas sp.]|uniref:heme utilization protein n=1 Tax=Pseudomonas sp. TaxID=306 RepID=UPI002B475168|nr:heme utilization protein [Pseudomonas sp.]HKS14521.1 heme utilization protein [Pseudomonas sp.]